jgi:hypothetical protein
VNDSAIRLISEVFLFGCLGVIWVVDVWLLWGRRWEWGRYDLYLLVVLVSVVRWMWRGAVVVWLWELLICVCNNSWVVSWLRPRHPVPGSLRYRAVPCWVRTVFAVKQAVETARLLHSSPAPTTSFVAATLGGGDNLGSEGPHQQGAGWQCCVPAVDCGCPDRSLTTKALSTSGWTAEGPWVFSGTRPCAGGALRIWHIFRRADTAPGGSWVDP